MKIHILRILSVMIIFYPLLSNAQNYWQPTNGPYGTGRAVISFVIDTSDHIFAGTGGYGICHSTDNGDSWKDIDTEKLGSYEIQGISNKPECTISCDVGRITARFIDESGNISKEIRMRAFLALTDDVPLIIGFKDILSRYRICFDRKKEIAFIEGT